MALGKRDSFPTICAQVNGAFIVHDLIRYMNWKPDKLTRHGDVFRAFCPVHRDEIFRSLVLNPRNNTCHCEHTGCPAHDPADFIELLARFSGKTMPEAIEDAVGHFGKEYFRLNDHQTATITELAAEARERRTGAPE